MLISVIGNAAAGYRLAWASRRQLLCVLLPIGAVALVTLTVLDVLVGGLTQADAVVENGVLRLPDAGWWRPAVVAAFWLAGLAAAALVTVGRARGYDVRPSRALRSALWSFPVYAAGLVVIAGITALAVWALAEVGVLAVLAVLLAAAVIGARMLVGLVAHPLGGDDWALTRGRVTATAGAFLLGGVAVPAVVANLLPDAGWVAAPAALPVVAVQAGILGHVYLLRRGTAAGSGTMPGAATAAGSGTMPGAGPAAGSGTMPGAGPAAGSGTAPGPGPAAGSGTAPGPGTAAGSGTMPGRSAGQDDAVPGRHQPGGDTAWHGAEADLAAVDARLADLSGAPARVLPWAGVLAAVLALLAPAGAALANPFHAPGVRWHDHGPAAPAAVAWPDGRHPTIATMSGAWFCDDDICDRFTSRNGGPAVWDGRGAAAISADGATVVKAVISGGAEDGGPFVHYARCTRDGCPEAWIPVRSSAREAVDWPELGAAVAPDGALWFLLAHPAEDTWRIVFLRCAEVGCATPQRYEAGTLERLAWDSETTAVPRAQLTIGPDEAPLATVRTGNAAEQVTCAPVTCARPRTASSFMGHPVSAWVAPRVLGGPVLSYEPGQLRDGESMRSLSSRRIAPDSGAVAPGGDRLYATAAEAATTPGWHVSIGEEDAALPAYWRQVLWRCDATSCTRQELDRSRDGLRREVMAVAADGRVLIVRERRILLAGE